MSQTGSEQFMAEGCLWEKRPGPATLVIFGASGDLTARKLIPALFNLHALGGLPERFAIVGAARSEFSDQAFRELMLGSCRSCRIDPPGWEDFASRLFYQRLDYAQAGSYTALAVRLGEIERALDLPGSRLFNLAIPPSLYGAVAEQLAGAGLAAEAPERGVWTRLVVEKPFGRDLASARELDATIKQGFGERQVFRIDHYLAKETVQNIMVLRFANAIFEPLWNRNFIDYVRINAAEALGVGRRAGYYEESGVLRDMFQNHIMQLLALVAAEPPARFRPDLVRDKANELFHSLRPLSPEDLAGNVVLGQYGPGQGPDGPAAGYRDEPGVRPDSDTPTYALMRLFVDNWRWQGVPFYLSSGKALKRKVTRIDIQFKQVPVGLFRHSLEGAIANNRLVLGIYPEEAIFLNFQAKKPGPRLCLRTSGLSFGYTKGEENAPQLDAYAKALADAMAGDQTLFWRQDSLEACWDFFDPVLGGCEQNDTCPPLNLYPAGSLGPQAALDMLPDGSWPEKP